MGMHFPPFLQDKDEILLVSPSGKIERKYVKEAMKTIQLLHFTPKRLSNVYKSAGSYAGTLEQRLKDLQEAFDSSSCKAILCTRGGYGAVHLLHKLDISLFKNHPKWLIGYSDITILHSLLQKEGYASIHGPMCKHIATQPIDETSTTILFNLLRGKLPKYTVPYHKYNREGEAVGTLVGGNMAVFSGLRGTSYDLITNNAILFLEDVNEAPYAIERMCYNLKLGGVFDKIKGLIVGQFTDHEENASLTQSVYYAIKEVTKEYDFPICFNFPAGHQTTNYPLILGATVNLSVNKATTKLRFIK